MLPDGRIPLLLSAHAEELIGDEARRLLDFVDTGEPEVGAVAATLLRLRRRGRHRAVVRAADRGELAAALRALVEGQDHALVSRSREPDAHRRAFVYPGQGNQWPGMGAEAYRTLRDYRRDAEACAAAFTAAGAASPLGYLTGATAITGSQVEAQAAQFTHAVALTAVWRAHGVAPDLTVGHSLGEVAAAYVAGAITLPDAAAVVVARATVLERLADGYGMAVLGLTPEDAQALIESVPGWLELAVVNAASSVGVSGERDAVDALLALASSRGVFARSVTMAFPAHTSLLDGLRTDLLRLLPPARFQETAIPFVGSATGQAVAPGTDFADYWFANLRNTVRFDRAAEAAVRAGANLFVEMSAHPALLFSLGQSAGDALTVGSGRRDAPLDQTLSDGIAAVAAHDAEFRWDDTVDTALPALRGFPNAPMRSVHLWALPQPLPAPPSLTLATEAWEIHRPAQRGLALRRTAVLDLTGPRGGLGDLLRDAVERHPGMVSAPVHDADLVLAVAPDLDEPDVHASVTALAALIGDGLLRYPEEAGTDCRDIWLVTTAAEQLTDDPTPRAAQAALAAMHRSIGFEYPDRAFRHLDLPSALLDEAAATVALDAVLGDGDELALRDTDGVAAVFARTEHEAVTTPESWADDPGVLDHVVITGGSGTVGRHYARYLADRGARRITLLSRHGATRIEPAGAQVETVCCDVTDPAALAAAAAEFGADGATLVIHAAGAAIFADHDELSAADFADTAAAKVQGLIRFAERWPLRADARILLCSSVSGLWGGRGHAAYAAVNRMVDVLAAQLRANGIRCAAVRFGLFGAGIVDGETVSRIGRSGLMPLDPDEAVSASLLDVPGDPVIYSADRARLQIFRDAPAPAAATSPPSGGDTTAAVVTELTAVLGVDAAAVDLAASLLDMGVDSLLALDLRKRLRRATGRSVPLAAMLGGMTGTELIAGLDDEPQRNEIPA